MARGHAMANSPDRVNVRFWPVADILKTQKPRRGGVCSYQ